MSKTYIAAILRRPAVPRSNKLKDAGSTAASSSSLSSVQVNPAGADASVFWKYFGLDEDGGLYVKKTESGEARNFWTYGNLAGGGIASNNGSGGGDGVSYLRSLLDVYHGATVLRADGTAVQDGDGLAYDATNSRWYARPGLVAGTDYVAPSTLNSYLTIAAAASAYAAKSLESVVAGIQALIPSAASSSNQLADKAFVNSSIASNTGTFQGTFSSIAQLPSSGVSTNDYAFVTTTDANNNTVYDRYKYNGVQWVFEYSLNNSSFTAAQWSAINSGVTSGKVSGYDDHLADVDIHITSAERTAWNAKTSNLGTITGITMNGVSKGTSGVVDLGTVITDLTGYVQDGEMEAYVDGIVANYQPLLSSDNKLDPAYIITDTTHRWWTDALATTLGGKLNVSDFRFDILCKSALATGSDLNTVFDTTRSDLTGKMAYYAYVESYNTGSGYTAGIHGFPATSNANALLTAGTYSDANTQHLYQVGFSSNGNIYYRNGYAEKENNTWGTAFGNGNWKKIVAEDHNGDVTVGGHLTLARGSRLRLDANGDAFFTRGSGNDYAMYISAGHLADGTTRAQAFFEASALCPNSTNDNANLGADWCYWNNIYAKRWYPNPSDQTKYIEYDANGYFHVHGTLVVDGDVVAGGIIQNN